MRRPRIFVGTARGNGYGGEAGWNAGYCQEYESNAPPNDCWTFWRRQFWTEFCLQQNFQTSLSKADSKTQNHGFGGFPSGQRPNDQKRWAGEPTTSL